jgi:hypothetical protein
LSVASATTHHSPVTTDVQHPPKNRPLPTTFSDNLPTFPDNLRHRCSRRRKNSKKTSEKSIKSGGNWRFLEGQSAISMSVYARRTEAQTAGMP